MDLTKEALKLCHYFKNKGISPEEAKEIMWIVLFPIEKKLRYLR